MTSSSVAHVVWLSFLRCAILIFSCISLALTSVVLELNPSFAFELVCLKNCRSRSGFKEVLKVLCLSGPFKAAGRCHRVCAVVPLFPRVAIQTLDWLCTFFALRLQIPAASVLCCSVMDFIEAVSGICYQVGEASIKLLSRKPALLMFSPGCRCAG